MFLNVRRIKLQPKTSPFSSVQCLQITFRSGPLGASRFSWIGSLSLSTHTYTHTLSTGYEAARHANMLWHFACCTDLDALSPPQEGHASVLQKCPRLTAPRFHLLKRRLVNLVLEETQTSENDLSITPLNDPPTHDWWFLMISTWVTLTGRKKSFPLHRLCQRSLDILIVQRGFRYECH